MHVRTMINGPAHSSNGSFKKERNAEVMQVAFVHVRTMMNGPAHSSGSCSLVGKKGAGLSFPRFLHSNKSGQYI